MKKSTFQDKISDNHLYIIIRKSTKYRLYLNIMTVLQFFRWMSTYSQPSFLLDQCLPMFFLVMKNKVATSVLSIDCNKEKVSRGKQLIYKAKQDIFNSNPIQNMLVTLRVTRGKARFTIFIVRSWEMGAIWLSTKWRYPKLYPSWR